MAIACLEQIVAPTPRQASEVLDQIRASRARLTQTGIAPLTDAFLDAAKQPRCSPMTSGCSSLALAWH